MVDNKIVGREIYLGQQMKIIDATSDTPGLTREEAELFLQSKLNLQLATIDEKGEPNIQPVWFYYDKDQRKFFFTKISQEN
jgi:nitroimidazol reductase NimA-like FMN-containing flavoprotein (pyridoxamine 5'-phosphate oxidase superfamily)